MIPNRKPQEKKLLGKMISCSMSLVVMVICWRIHGVTAETYSVGDSSGWTMGKDYSTWTADKTFAVGDTLVFNYAPGHNVDEVSEKDYKSCTTGNAIATDRSGTTSIILKFAGPHYFICSIPGHCNNGMKLAVNTVASTAGGATITAAPSSETTSTAIPAGPVSRNPSATEPSFSPALSPAFAAMVPFLFVVLKRLVW